MTTTPVATLRAAISWTGLGNEKRERSRSRMGSSRPIRHRDGAQRTGGLGDCLRPPNRDQATEAVRMDEIFEGRWARSPERWQLTWAAPARRQPLKVVPRSSGYLE